MPDLPGGMLELDEGFETAALREVREETGVKLRTEDLTLIDDRELMLSGRSLHGVLYKVCLNVDNISITLSDEHDEYHWTKPEKISGLSGFHEKSISYALMNDLLSQGS
ncbi:Nucleoside triphosphatase NudI [compost metagenome]